jgi:REP element-mobilizing transposase RayT
LRFVRLRCVAAILEWGHPVAEPLALFITFTTYGAWLHGRDPGSVDRAHNAWGTPVLPPDPEREQQRRAQMRQPAYVLDDARRQVVLNTILEVARHRRWKVWAVHVRSNHVHIVVSAPARPEKVMVDFKAWASRRLRESFGEDADRDRWTQHGSTKYLWNEQALADSCTYVLDQQGDRMAHYDGRSEPEA